MFGVVSVKNDIVRISLLTFISNEFLITLESAWPPSQYGQASFRLSPEGCSTLKFFKLGNDQPLRLDSRTWQSNAEAIKENVAAQTSCGI